MESKTLKANQSYIGHHYNRYLKQCFGINSCSKQQDALILSNKKILADWQTYRDVSSPVLGDRLLTNDCRKIYILDYSKYYSNQNDIYTASIDTPVAASSIPTFILEFNVTAEQDAADIITITNSNFENVRVEVIRSVQPLPGIIMPNDQMYFLKPLISDTVTFSHSLVEGEYIKITTIPL